MTTQKSPGTMNHERWLEERQERGKLVYSVAEAAEALGISRPTLYALLHREDFPSFRVGGRVLVSVEGLRLWVAAQTGATEGGQTDG